MRQFLLANERCERLDRIEIEPQVHRTWSFGLCFLYLRNVKGRTLQQWAEDHGIALHHIQPGKPQQNAYIERYNKTVRHEWLGQYNFETVTEVQNHATSWLWTYNNERPNMGIGGITPAQKLKQQMELKTAA
jgi:hypothetical protein